MSGPPHGFRESSTYIPRHGDHGHEAFNNYEERMVISRNLKYFLAMIQEYMNYLENIKGYSPNTTSSYAKDLHNFVEWARFNIVGARWSTITITDIDKYITAMSKSGLKPATTNRHLSALSGLFRYMKREGLINDNPCHYESRRKIAHTIPNTIPINDLKMAYENAYGVVKVMLALLISTGIRIQELLDLEWDDINFVDNSLKIHGKGNKERRVYTNIEYLETLRTVYQYQCQKGKIFLMNQREARRMVFDALKPYTKAKQLSPHAIRHSFATHLANEGVNASTIGAILGHKQLETTQKYIDLTDAPVRNILQNHNILN